MKPIKKNNFFVALENFNSTKSQTYWEQKIHKLFRFRGKSQIISMDFIMTFVVYIFALSVFFFALGDALPVNDADLDVQADLLFNKLAEINESVDFLDNSKIKNLELGKYFTKYNYDSGYRHIFRDFNNPAFTRTDYCIYLEDPRTGLSTRNVAAGLQEGYTIYFDDTNKCGEVINKVYTMQPYCAKNIKTESIVLTKPVLYNGQITNLKILICAEKR